MRTADRNALVPSQRGRNVLPNSPFYSQLLRLAYDTPSKTIIRDVNLGQEKSRIQLLTDVLELQDHLRHELDESVNRALERGESVFIAILAPGGYESAVAVLGALALGMAVVPISSQAPLDEASYIIEKSRAVAALTASSADQLGSSLEQHIRVKQKQPSFRKISIAPCLRSWHYQPREIFTSSNWYQDDNNPAFVIFTSGTTGRPKGAIHRRGLIHEVARSIADHYKLTEDDLLLHLLPVHHGTGAYFSFFPFLICGACIEFRSGNFSAERTWDRWRKGGVTFFSGVPTMYVRMMRYFEAHIGNSKFAGTTAEYESAARSIRGMLCGGSTLPRPVQHFWETLRDGKRILDRYGSTESGLVFREALDCDQSPDGTVGLLSPGVEVKFAGGGDEGELLLRSPTMFMGYLFDEEATKRAHDADGFYKTGDIVRREGDYYFILGRASVDILKSGGYKISALDIERECLGLDYINEVMVVGVDDTEWGQRVAAVVSLRDDQKVYSYRGLNDLKELTLDQLRHDLSDKLAKYKLPTLLRVIPSELPKTPTGKVSKKLLGPVLFPPHYTGVPDVQVYASSSGKDMAKKARL